MHYKELTFSSYVVIVENEKLEEEKFYKTFISGKEIKCSIKENNYALRTVKVNNYANIYIEFGNPLPRSENVINKKTYQSEANPRKEYQYEPKQEFALIDFSTSTLWLSNTNKKVVFTEILKQQLKTKDIIVKNVYDEEEFVKLIKKIDQIKFSALPNLFSGTQTLTQLLTEEILGYGSHLATLSLKYEQGGNITDRLKSKIENLLFNKAIYKSLVITGRDAEGFGIIFNNEILSKRISLNVSIDNNRAFIVENVYFHLNKRLNEQ